MPHCEGRASPNDCNSKTVPVALHNPLCYAKLCKSCHSSHSAYRFHKLHLITIDAVRDAVVIASLYAIFFSVLEINILSRDSRSDAPTFHLFITLSHLHSFHLSFKLCWVARVLQCIGEKRTFPNDFLRRKASCTAIFWEEIVSFMMPLKDRLRKWME